MRSIEKISLQEFISNMNSYCVGNPTGQAFCDNLDLLEMGSLQSLSCQNDKEYLNRVDRMLRIIMSIVANPHISNKREEVVTRIEQAQQLSEEEFTRVLQDGSMWKRHRAKMVPENVYYYQHVDELAIYENQFICLLVDLLDKDLSLYSDFYLALLPSYTDDRPAVMDGAASQKILRKIDLLRKRINFIKNTHFYKVVSKIKRISRNVQRTNILLKDNLYKQAFRFYRQFISYENEGVVYDDLQSYYFVLIIKELLNRGFTFDGQSAPMFDGEWCFSNAQFKLKLNFDKALFGFELSICDKFSNHSARHLLLLSPTISFSEIKIPEQNLWDTVEAISLWNCVAVDKPDKKPVERPLTEAQLVALWLENKLAHPIANVDVYARYCPVCKGTGIEITDGVHVCKRCKSQYVFTRNDNNDTILWLQRIGGVK